ncbi:unnamed protein product [Rotaria socialis]|uniref:BSD domain-containing protein n=3 Tax=Rotaria socialis TaxID=392032 RepID=A0A818X030_9BILA|nr:unnamed protein product [Rotaria socialis]CAF3432590.1 unnamed protein product [Rotaria socialis]CAF3730474.1 unnamed protein product [Rotaria socialis]CAF4191023.1 unnamed protein product [Rotaria socialis]CAF4566250.1 unnamed protein product [Rotaria socialis]
MTESSVPEAKPSAWFSNFGLTPNLTNTLTNLSSSIVDATSKVGTAASTLQKTIQERLYTSNQNEQQTSETTKPTKDLTSILTDLSSSVLKSAQQFKQVFEEKTIIGNFTKEQEKFLTDKRTQQRRTETGVLPWIGYEQEEEMKKQILDLSKEKRNFLRDAPPGAVYHFDMTTCYPVALAILEVDENLKQMRFDLVPKQINEELFWRNYFYRVSLIKQATQLTALASGNTNHQSTDENRHPSNNLERRTSELNEKTSDINQEFVSEDYDTSALSMDDIRREIEQLTITKRSSNKTKDGSPDLDESEWDKGLADELENVSAEELEAQINQLLSDSK